MRAPSFASIRTAAEPRWTEDLAAMREGDGDVGPIVAVALDASITRGDPLAFVSRSVGEAFDRVAAVDRELAAIAFHSPPPTPFALAARRRRSGLLDLESSPFRLDAIG
jgi:hypothetical protein